MKKILLLSSMFTLVFVGCKKSSSNNTNTSCTLSSSSIVGSYKMTAQVATNGSTTIDIFNDPNQTSPCFKDNIYTFNANGTYAVSDGVDVCNPSDAETGTWVLQNSNFTVNDGTGSETGTVSEFTCSSFKVTLSGMPGESITATFTRQ